MYSYLIGAAVALALLAGTLFFGINIGEDRKEAEWQTRENAELTSANQQIVDLTAKIRKQEADHAAAVNLISTRYQKELSNVKALREADRRAVASGALRLFDPACREGSGGAAAGPTGAASGGRDGAAGCELSGAATEFLLALAVEADEVTRQLAACQGVVTADRMQP